MNKKDEFWTWYDEVQGKLNHRAATFRKMFEHLDTFEQPITIVETGCARQQDAWLGDGCSTVLFDKYVTVRNDGSNVKTVDLSAQAVAVCKTLVSDKVEVVQSDSVPFLDKFAKAAHENDITVPLYYLDSFDLDWTYWQPSAIHHLKELTSIHGYLRPDTLVVVDDCMQDADFLVEDGKVLFRGQPKPGGKGRLVAEYAETIGAKLEFSSYHAGWSGFNA